MLKRFLSLLLALLLVFSAGALAEEAGEEAADRAAEEITAAEDPAVPDAAEGDPADAESAEENAEEPEEQPAEEPAEEPEEQTAEEPAELEEQLAEEPEEEPAFPCPHENTETVYYFDVPDYRSVDDKCHSVAGRAVAEETCADCGAVLSVRVENNAQEIRPHVFVGGRCALCGWEFRPGEGSAPEITEMLIALSPAEGNRNQYFCTLTQADLNKAGDVLVLRPSGGGAAVILQADSLRDQISGGGTLIAEMGRPDARSFSAFIRLYHADGTKVRPGSRGISLRIYAENSDTPLTVTFAGSGGTARTEEACWSEEGYWTCSWQGDGLYTY